MKNLLMAIAIAVVLVISCGSLISDWWGMHLMIGEEFLSPWEGIVAFSVVAVVFAVVGFIVAVSVVGAIAIGLFAGAISIFVAGVWGLWPLLLVGGIIYFIRRNRESVAIGSQ